MYIKGLVLNATYSMEHLTIMIAFVMDIALLLNTFSCTYNSEMFVS